MVEDFICQEKRKDYIKQQKKYDERGYDKTGYNKEGYDKKGFNKEGYDENGYNENGYNKEGYDKTGILMMVNFVKLVHALKRSKILVF